MNLDKAWKVTKENILYKCGWSPFEGTEFNSSIISTFVNGERIFHKGLIKESKSGMRLKFKS